MNSEMIVAEDKSRENSKIGEKVFNIVAVIIALGYLVMEIKYVAFMLSDIGYPVLPKENILLFIICIAKGFLLPFGLIFVVFMLKKHKDLALVLKILLFIGLIIITPLEFLVGGLGWGSLLQSKTTDINDFGKFDNAVEFYQNEETVFVIPSEIPEGAEILSYDYLYNPVINEEVKVAVTMKYSDEKLYANEKKSVEEKYMIGEKSSKGDWETWMITGVDGVVYSYKNQMKFNDKEQSIEYIYKNY